MNTLVIVETAFGTTAELAEAIASVLGTTAVPAQDAPTTVPAGTQLVVLGAPTHNMGLPSAASRAQAVQRGGQPPRTGVREWIQAASVPAGVRVVTFDTVTGRSIFNGSAAKAAAGMLSKKRVAATRGESFLVTGTPPVLADGELDRARGWAAALS